MFTYHYCALCFSGSGGQKYYDGVVATNDAITTVEGYSAVREYIANKLEVASPDDLVILSLSRVN